MTKFLGVATDEQRLTSVKVGSGTGPSVITAMGRISQALTPAAVATITCAEQTFTVPGLAVGDAVTVSPPSVTAGVAPVCARVSAANTLAITFCNPTAGSLTPAAGTYQISFVR